MKLTLRSAKWIGAIGLGVLVLASLPSTRPDASPVPMPLILSKVQALGELRTARYSYQHVFEQTSSREPQDWARMIPGASSLVVASTRNTALASATAQVDAGVDLSKAKLDGQTIVLPEPSIYRPLVDLKLHQVRPGTFWRDDNMALRATEAMRLRVTQAARKQGIAEEAKRNALAAIHRIAPGATITFR
jgi:hypothetical protein